MRASSWLLGSLLLLSPLSAGWCASIGTVNQLVIFGDSLSDDGNALYLENEYKNIFGQYPSGVPVPIPPNYTYGKFTDGPDTTPATSAPTGLWIDQLASKMGLSQPQASYSGGRTTLLVGRKPVLIPLSQPAFLTWVTSWHGLKVRI